MDRQKSVVKSQLSKDRRAVSGLRWRDLDGVEESFEKSHFCFPPRLRFWRLQTAGVAPNRAKPFRDLAGTSWEPSKETAGNDIITEDRRCLFLLLSSPFFFCNCFFCCLDFSQGTAQKSLNRTQLPFAASIPFPQPVPTSKQFAPNWIALS